MTTNIAPTNLTNFLYFRQQALLRPILGHYGESIVAKADIGPWLVPGDAKFVLPQ